jgi:hypothetical protein
MFTKDKRIQSRKANVFQPITPSISSTIGSARGSTMEIKLFTKANGDVSKLASESGF